MYQWTSKKDHFVKEFEVQYHKQLKTNYSRNLKHALPLLDMTEEKCRIAEKVLIECNLKVIFNHQYFGPRLISYEGIAEEMKPTLAELEKLALFLEIDDCTVLFANVYKTNRLTYFSKSKFCC